MVDARCGAQSYNKNNGEGNKLHSKLGHYIDSIAYTDLSHCELSIRKVMYMEAY